MRRIGIGLLAVIFTVCAPGCAAMMMGGGGGYEPPPDTCTREQRDAGRCKSP